MHVLFDTECGGGFPVFQDGTGNRDLVFPLPSEGKGRSLNLKISSSFRRGKEAKSYRPTGENQLFRTGISKPTTRF